MYANTGWPVCDLASCVMLYQTVHVTGFVWIILSTQCTLWKQMFSHEIFTLKFSSCSILLAPIFPVKVEKSFELFFCARHSPPRFRTDPTEPWSYQKSRSGPWHSWYECQVTMIITTVWKRSKKLVFNWSTISYSLIENELFEAFQRLAP